MNMKKCLGFFVVIHGYELFFFFSSCYIVWQPLTSYMKNILNTLYSFPSTSISCLAGGKNAHF